MGGLTSLATPIWLLGILVVLAILAGYVYNERRRSKRALKFANMSVLDSVAPPGPNRWRHVPIALLSIGLILLMIALSGPQAMRKVPRSKATVVLVVDVSLSMKATDVIPNRLDAAKEAAKKFVGELPQGMNLGIVSYAGTAQLLVSPTPDRSLATNAIDHLDLAQRTATGEGIYAAIQSIKNIRDVLGGKDAAPPARIILESDGKQTVPTDLDDPRGGFTAARKAKEEGIPISTISFGTPNGTVDIEGQNIPVPVDDASLKQIADLSGGQFFSASSLSDLNEAYGTLRDEIGWEMQKGDNSRIWVLWATGLLVLGAAGAVAFNRRLP